MNPIQVPQSVSETVAWAFLRKTPAAIGLAALLIIGFIASIFAPIIRENDTILEARALENRNKTNPPKEK
jgi:hypothetical protein